MKRILIAAAAAALALALAGCGQQAAKAEKVELSVLNYLDITSPEAKVWDKLVEAFKAANPNVDLKVDNLFNEPFHQKTAALAASGSLPDVFYMWPGGRSAALMKNGLAKDLYGLLGAGRDNYTPASVVPQMDGKLFELPIAFTSTHVLYANKGLLDKLGIAMPQTYEDLVKMVPVLKKAGVDVVAMANKDAWVMESCLFSAIVGRIAGEDWLMKAVRGEASFADKPFVDSIKMMKKFYDDGVFPKSSISTGYADVPNIFASGKAAFLIDGDWRVGAFTGADGKDGLIPRAQQGDYVLTVIPDLPGQLPGTSGMTSSVTGTGYGMNASIAAGSDREKAAWAFISFMAGPEAAKIRIEGAIAFPAYKVDTANLAGLEPLSQARVAFYPQHSGSPVLDNVIGPEPFNVLNPGLQAVALGTMKPEELAAKFEAAVALTRGK